MSDPGLHLSTCRLISQERPVPCAFLPPCPKWTSETRGMPLVFFFCPLSSPSRMNVALNHPSSPSISRTKEDERHGQMRKKATSLRLLHWRSSLSSLTADKCLVVVDFRLPCIWAVNIADLLLVDVVGPASNSVTAIAAGHDPSSLPTQQIPALVDETGNLFVTPASSSRSRARRITSPPATHPLHMLWRVWSWRVS